MNNSFTIGTVKFGGTKMKKQNSEIMYNTKLFDKDPFEIKESSKLQSEVYRRVQQLQKEQNEKQKVIDDLSSFLSEIRKKNQELTQLNEDFLPLETLNLTKEILLRRLKNYRNNTPVVIALKKRSIFKDTDTINSLPRLVTALLTKYYRELETKKVENIPQRINFITHTEKSAKRLRNREKLLEQSMIVHTNNYDHQISALRRDISRLKSEIHALKNNGNNTN